MIPGKERRPFWTQSVFALVLLPVLALLFNWPYLAGGFQLDDILIYNAMQLDPLTFSRWQGVWSGGDHFGFERLWWKDLDVNVGFWRPIPSLIFEGSIRLFDRNAVPLHLLSILVHGAVSAALYLLVRGLTGRHGPALLAGLFFVACEDHSAGVGWIATMTDLLCVLFILFALLGHVRWLKRREPAALVWSLLALAVAMACKETAIIAPIAVVLLTFFMPGGRDEDDFGSITLRERGRRAIGDMMSWVPAVLMLVAYLAMYRALGLGNMNNLLYIDPVANPGEYLIHLVPNLPVMWLGTFSPAPLWLILWIPELVQRLAVPGLVVFLGWLLALWPLRHRSLALWALVLYLVALLPQLCTDASERGLYFPMIPASILIALVAMTVGPLARRTVPTPPVSPRWTRFVGWMALLGILVPGVYLSATGPGLIVQGFTKLEDDMRTALPYLEESRPEHVVILNASTFMLCIYTQDYLDYLSDDSRNVWLLSAAYGVFSLERTGESDFVIRTDRPGWISNFIARVMRTEPELSPGRSYEEELFTATIVETTEAGSDVLGVRFDFNRPLDDAGVLFLRWNGEAFEPMDIASLQIGETVELADTSDIFGSES